MHVFGYACDQAWLSWGEECVSIPGWVYLCILLVWVTVLLKNIHEINSKRTQKFFLGKKKGWVEKLKLFFVSSPFLFSGLLFFWPFLQASFFFEKNWRVNPREGSLQDDKALENRQVLRCGQECLSSVLISFCFVRVKLLIAAILFSLCRYAVSLSTLNCDSLLALYFFTQFAPLSPTWSCLRSNSMPVQTIHP